MYVLNLMLKIETWYSVIESPLSFGGAHVNTILFLSAEEVVTTELNVSGFYAALTDMGLLKSELPYLLTDLITY